MTTQTKVGTFEIIAARDGGFDVYDRCTFNHWESPKGMVTQKEAETWCEWAHTFKTGRTFMALPEWCNLHRNQV